MIGVWNLLFSSHDFNFMLIFLLVGLKNGFARAVDAYCTCYHEAEMY